MPKKYVFVRMRREDFDKIMKEKKEPMEKDLREIMGKTIKIKNTQLFRIAANSVWDLGGEYQHKMIRAIRIKRGDLKL